MHVHPDQRVVIQLPLAELWDNCGPVRAMRSGLVDASQVKQLLRAGSVRFVVADLGNALQWLPTDRIFDFWKAEAAPRLLDPSLTEWDIEALPGEYGYAASLWEVPEGDPVVLFECHH